MLTLYCDDSATHAQSDPWQTTPRMRHRQKSKSQEGGSSGIPLRAKSARSRAPHFVPRRAPHFDSSFNSENHPDSRNLLSAYGMTVAVAHFVAFEVFDVVDGLDGALAAGGMRAGVSVVGMEMVIDVAVKTLWTVKPGTDADEDTAAEPLRAVIAVGSAVVGWNVVIAIRTDRRRSDFDGHLSLGLGSGYGEADCNDSS